MNAEIKRWLLATVLCIPATGMLLAQSDTTDRQTDMLKKMSLDELMEVRVVSVTDRPEHLYEAAAAIQVVTADDISRSGSLRLPEAVSLATNLQTTQVNAQDFGISARGFNGLPGAGGILANKLHVMTDGRSIYTPILGGVYWDVQNYLLEDIDRIEVVSGPGGTLWGANAVNGVINIISKDARETQGWYASVLGGTFIRTRLETRYGFAMGARAHARVYAQYFNHGASELANGKPGRDGWNHTQTGFRMDLRPDARTHWTIQGDAYGGTSHMDSTLQKNNADGQNALVRYSHHFSERSNLRVLTYFDRNWRGTPENRDDITDYELYTYEIDIRHRLHMGDRHVMLYGIGYQLRQDRTSRSFVPKKASLPLYSAFFQDEISLIPERLKLIAGSKFIHNTYTGWEIQPSARLAYAPGSYSWIWAAISRAVRIPSRLDADITIVQPFDSEKVIARELGYRVRPLPRLSVAVATFYNTYRDLRSLDIGTTEEFPTVVANNQEASSWGLELNGDYQMRYWWRLRGGYTFYENRIEALDPAVLPVSKEFESVDPKHTFLLQSIMDVHTHWQIDAVLRYFNELPAQITTERLPSFTTLDLRVARRVGSFKLSIVGQNILRNSHREGGKYYIPGSLYGRVVWTP